MNDFKQMAEKGVPVTINLSMTADLTDDPPIFNPKCVAVMEEIRKAVRGKEAHLPEWCG